MIYRLALLVVLAWPAAGCIDGGSYVCASDGQCGGGICEPNGFCSESDPDCANGRRYSDTAGDGLDGECVGEEFDAGPDAAIDADLPDAAPTCGTSGSSCCPGASCNTGLVCSPNDMCTACVTGSTGGGDVGCATKGDGTLTCWGGNSAGQVAVGDVGSNVLLPVGAGELQAVTHLSASLNHTCARTAAGDAWCWGENSDGQLGDGTTATRRAPVQMVLPNLATRVAAADDRSCSIVDDAKVYCSGPSSMSTQIMFGASDLLAVEVAAGSNHVCAIRNVGVVACWGTGTVGQLGNSANSDSVMAVAVTTVARATQISAGGDHSCMRTATGRVLCWGRNTSGELGDGSKVNRNQPALVPFLLGVASVASGQSHTCAVTGDGSVFCWGANDFGQLGNGSATPTTLPTPVDIEGVVEIAAGGSHTCARKDDGSLWCWGLNDVGQLGTEQQSSTVPTLITSIAGVRAITAGRNHTCAVDGANRLRCWGGGQSGKLGTGDGNDRVSPTVVTALRDVTSVSIGPNHGCAATRGRAWCWGDNTNGQLADATIALSPLPIEVAVSGTVLDVVVGARHSCALLDSGVAQCWGDNNAGQLGKGDLNPTTTPTAVSGLANATAIAAGSEHTCAVLNDNLVNCWGQNSLGQLGDGSAVANETTPQTVGIVTGIQRVDAAGDHTCAQDGSGRLWCWGSNATGELGGGSAPGAFSNTPIVVLRADNQNAIDAVDELSLGTSHSCARVGSTVLCWGNNADRQLGDPSATFQNQATTVAIFDGASSVGAGGRHTCALIGGAVSCVGANDMGQFGDGTTNGGATPGEAQIECR